MPQNTTEVILERRQRVAALYLQGKFQSEIAALVGVSQRQVSYDLDAVRTAWLASTLRDFDAAKAEELAKIDTAERAYWEGWERSLEPREVTLTEQREGGTVRDKDGTVRSQAPLRKASIRREGQAGDPRFLDGVLKCVERRCAILGLDAPQKFDIQWDELTDEQLERLAHGEPPTKVLAPVTSRPLAEA